MTAFTMIGLLGQTMADVQNGIHQLAFLSLFVLFKYKSCAQFTLTCFVVLNLNRFIVKTFIRLARYGRPIQFIRDE